MSHYQHERGWLDSEVWGYSAYDERSAWSWMIGEAAFEEYTKNIGGIPVVLERGQFTASLRFMGDKWNWQGKGAKDKVRRFLDKLERWGMISSATDRATGQTIITICNYNKYQGKRGASATDSATPTRHPRDSDTTATRQTRNPSTPSIKDSSYEETSTPDSEGVSRETRKATKTAAKPDNVSEAVWYDYVSLRKQKRAALTQTALDGIRREAEKAGWTLEEAIRECCARGWQAFKAEWVNKSTGGNHETTRRVPTRQERIDAAGDAALDEIYRDIDARYGEGESEAPERPDQTELQRVQRIWGPTGGNHGQGEGVHAGSGHGDLDGDFQRIRDLDAHPVTDADTGGHIRAGAGGKGP